MECPKGRMIEIRKQKWVVWCCFCLQNLWTSGCFATSLKANCHFFMQEGVAYSQHGGEGVTSRQHDWGGGHGPPGTLV